jgi:hypothetical protein
VIAARSANFGVAENRRNRSLRLERKKGTVYNEMVTSMDQPGRLLYYAAWKWFMENAIRFPLSPVVLRKRYAR